MFYLLFRIHWLDPIYEKTGVLRPVREAGVSHLYSLPSGIFPPTALVSAGQHRVCVPKRVWVRFLRLGFSEKEGFTDSWASEFSLETGVGFQPHMCVCFEKVTEREKITQVFLLTAASPGQVRPQKHLSVRTDVLWPLIQTWSGGLGVILCIYKQ